VKQVAILAGGKGTRLEAALGGLPKPMAPIAGKPVLEHQIELARAHGFDDVVLFIHHKAEVIQNYLGDGAKWGVHISYVIEKEPLGTAGSLLSGLDLLADRFMVFYADTLVHLDLGAMARTHEARGADATLFIHPNDHPQDSDLVEIDDHGWVTAFHPYPHPDGAYLRNLVNAALYVFEKKCLLSWTMPVRKLDFGKDVFPGLLREGARLFGYRARGYIKDMGTPERLARVNHDLQSGIMAKKGSSAPSGVVFLDRDGTINVEVNRVSQPDQFALIPGTPAAVKELNRAAVPVIVITNQPVIARGETSEAGLRIIHDKMETLLGAEGAYINDLYYCPHHPDKGFPGERADLKIACACRKPAIGLLERAVADWSIDLAKSWYIGDTTTDLRTARNAGVRSILVRTGHQGADGLYPERADFEFFTLNEAVDFILHRHAGLLEQARELVAGVRAGEKIALGGLARCGKSMLASLIQEALRERHLKVKILSLDNWILDADQRKGSSVRDRFDYPAIEAALATLAPKPTPQGTRLTLPTYDRKTRSRRENGNELVLFPEEVLLIDGVIALDIPAVRELCTFTIYCSCPETTRRERFLKEYQLRGWDEAKAVALFEERAAEESVIVLDSASFAAKKMGLS
jgi:histidinol-phosphate phosphatase family protein